MTTTTHRPEHAGQHAASRRTRGATARRVATGVGLGAAAVAMTAGGDTGPGLCLVRHLTGGYCPGCGGTRAALHMVGGDVAAAWQDHPWVVLAVAQLALVGVVAAIWFVVQRSSLRRPAPPTWRTLAEQATIFNVVALLGIWVARLATGAIPSPL